MKVLLCDSEGYCSVSSSRVGRWEGTICDYAGAPDPMYPVRRTMSAIGPGWGALDGPAIEVRLPGGAWTALVPTASLQAEDLTRLLAGPLADDVALAHAKREDAE